MIKFNIFNKITIKIYIIYTVRLIFFINSKIFLVHINY
jgi:hypothetical protein